MAGALIRLLAIVIAAGLAMLGAAQAKWPHDRPITFVVPTPPGNGGDIAARAIAEALKVKLNAAVIVENKPGASGNIGQAFVARAEPDGYTFVVTSPGPGANNMLTFKSLPFNPLTDFTYVMRLCEQSVILAAGPKFSGGLDDLVALLKSKPELVMQTAIPGTGTYGHMIALAFQDMVGAKLNLVPYRSGPQIVPDLLAGRVDISFDLAPAYLELIRAGQLRALAVITENRVDELPGVPTFHEKGLNFSAAAWYGLEGPKGVPADIVDQLNRAITDVLENDKDVRAKMIAVGLTPRPSTPAAFEELVRAEVGKWRPVVEKYNLAQQ